MQAKVLTTLSKEQKRFRLPPVALERGNWIGTLRLRSHPVADPELQSHSLNFGSRPPSETKLAGPNWATGGWAKLRPQVAGPNFGHR
jgi:hypothetical protein